MKVKNKILLLIMILLSLFTISACVNTPQLTEEEIKQNQAIKEFLKLDLISYAEGDDENNVTQDITLVTSYSSFPIFWESSNEHIKIQGNKGVVTQRDGDVIVPLKATIIVRDNLFEEIEFILVVRKGETPVYYQVTLDLNGGTLNNSGTVFILEDGMAFELDEEPVKEGYKFTGWTLNGEPYDFTQGVYGDIVLVAQYEKDIENYLTVTLDTNGGSLPTGSPLSLQVLKGNLITTEISNPTKNGYTFEGWYLNDIRYEFDEPVTSNITLVARYEEILLDNEYFSLTLPSNVTADIENLNQILKGTDVLLTVSKTTGKDTIVYVNDQCHFQDSSGNIEIEIKSNTVVTTQFIDETISIYDARRMTQNEIVNIKGIVTGRIPEKEADYIYINDGTATIMLFSAIHPHLKRGDLIFIKGGMIGDVYHNVVIYPQGTEEVLKENQTLPSPIHALDVSKGTLDHAGLSLQGQRFNIENLILVENAPTEKGKNFKVEDSYGNQVQIRVHKYLTNPALGEILAALSGLKVGDMISLNGAHLGLFWWQNDPDYIVQFMLSSADEIILPDVIKHKVTFILNNGDSNYVANIVDGRTIATNLIPRPTKSGFKFTGWYLNADLFDFNLPVLGPMTLSAGWEESTEPDNPLDPIDPNNDAVINNQNDPVVISYYNGINFSASASSLFSSLKSLVSQKRGLSYDAAKSWLCDADRDIVQTNKLRGIYDQTMFEPNYGSGWNREHVWPQSKLGGAPKGEAHNLRVADPRTNNSRSNYIFSETSTSTGNLGYRIGSYWWPGDMDKGDVARISMFMNLRYGLNLSNNINLNVLYKWHIEDPVDAFEIQRNNVIHDAQGNRNPFIDYPEIVAKLYDTAQAQMQTQIHDLEVFSQTNVEYNLNMTNLNITIFDRKSLVI